MLLDGEFRFCMAFIHSMIILIFTVFQDEMFKRIVVDKLKIHVISTLNKAKRI